MDWLKESRDTAICRRNFEQMLDSINGKFFQFVFVFVDIASENNAFVAFRVANLVDTDVFTECDEANQALFGQESECLFNGSLDCFQFILWNGSVNYKQKSWLRNARGNGLFRFGLIFDC